MELALWVYFIETVLTIDVVPDWTDVFVFTMLAFIGCVIGSAIRADMYRVPFKDTWDKTGKKLCKPAAWIVGTVFVLNLIGQFVPSKQTAYAMAAAYGVGEVYRAASESEDVQRVAGKSLLVLEQSLDKYLGEDSAEEVSEQTAEE